jgi:hypothetical protein
MNDAAQQIKHFNAGRDPERLALKLGKMRADPFIFLRGTCHLFYAACPASPCSPQRRPPGCAAICTCRTSAATRATTGSPISTSTTSTKPSWPPARWTSCASWPACSWAPAACGQAPGGGLLCRVFIDAYAAALAEGKARWVERETAVGLVRDLLGGSAAQAPGLSRYRTELKGKRRRSAAMARRPCRSTTPRAEVDAFIARFAQTRPTPVSSGPRRRPAHRRPAAWGSSAT